MRFIPVISAVFAVFFALSFVGCSQDEPTAPTNTPVPAESEPNDSSGTADDINGKTIIKASITDSGLDVDWFTFTLAGTCDVTLETTGGDIDGDTRMWLRNSGETQIEYDDDDGTNTYSLIQRTGVNALAAGIYYVEIDEFAQNEEIGTYYLSITMSCP